MVDLNFLELLYFFNILAKKHCMKLLNIVLFYTEIIKYSCFFSVGLNVYSMLKHETLVLTLAAVEKLEEKLLLTMHHIDSKDKKFERNKDMY